MTPTPKAVPNIPSASELSADQLLRYRRLRRDGVAAIHAYRTATAQPSELRYRCGPGEGTITILSAARLDLTGLVVTATTELDPAPDISWLGKFTDTWSRDVVEINRYDRGRYRYFLPTETAAQHRAELSRRGFAHGVAQERADRAARDAAVLAHNLEHHFVRVEVRKAGVLLGAAENGVDVTPDAHLETEIAVVVDECGLVDEAVEQASEALLPLISALAS